MSSPRSGPPASPCGPWAPLAPLALWALLALLVVPSVHPGPTLHAPGPAAEPEAPGPRMQENAAPRAGERLCDSCALRLQARSLARSQGSDRPGERPGLAPLDVPRDPELHAAPEPHRAEPRAPPRV